MNLNTPRLLIALALVAVVAVYFAFKPDPAPPGVHVESTPAPEVANVPTERVEIAPPIQVYKPDAKKKLNLPEPVQQDAAQHVIASSKTANDERQHTITTVIDANTGNATNYDRVDPLPWIAVSTKSQVGLFYGYRGGEQIVRLQGQQELLQIKAMRVGAIATVDSDGETFVGAGLWARW